MGYQITFIPTVEAMQKYKPVSNFQQDGSTIEEFKYELIHYVMKNGEKGGVPQQYKQIDLLLRCIVNSVDDHEKHLAYKRWSEDKDHQLWYCGWEFSKPSQLDREDTISLYIERLIVLSDLVTTPDYFEENGKFFKKLEEVRGTVSDFIESTEEISIHTIIDDLDEFKVKSDKA